jgi:hypothetical protein
MNASGGTDAFKRRRKIDPVSTTVARAEASDFQPNRLATDLLTSGQRTRWGGLFRWTLFLLGESSSTSGRG